MAVTKEQVQELYVGYLGRAADKAGLDYWLAELNNPASGMTLETLRANIVEQQPEYTITYGGLSVSDTVAKIYQNLFAREAEPAGLAYWVEQVESGSVPVDHLIVAFLNAASPRDREVVNSKVSIAELYTDASGDAFNATDAADLVSGIDGSSAAYNAALAQIAAINGTTYRVLTNGIDNLQGGAGKDTFLATASQVQLADRLDGDAGEDTLKLTVTDSDYTDTERAGGFKNVDIAADNIETLEVTARTQLSQGSATFFGPASDTLTDGTRGGQNGFTDPDARTGFGQRDSDAVDTIITLTSFDDLKVIKSVESEVNGSALTFNDIQKMDGLNLVIEDTSSAHNFLFDDEADLAKKDDEVTLTLSENRGLTINMGETPFSGSSRLPESTTFANARDPLLLGEVNNDGQGTSFSGYYGQNEASQSKIDVLNIESNVREPSGAARNFRNEVLDLNVGSQLRDLNISGDAQLKIGLKFQQEQEVVQEQTASVSAGVQVANPNDTGYSLTPALGSDTRNAEVLRDFALSSPAYALDAGIRNVDASQHYAGVDQNSAYYEDLPVADLTLDLSNGYTDTDQSLAQVFTYKGSQGDDSVNFGTRSIDKDIDLGSGNDTLVAGRGADTIRGGEGDDLIKHNNAKNVTGAAGLGFDSGSAVTVYGGEGNDQVIIAGIYNDATGISLVDLGTGDDTLYVDDSEIVGPDVFDSAEANNRIAGGLGKDTIIVTTEGGSDSVLDLVIYGDAAVEGEHGVADLVQPDEINARGSERAIANRDVKANFIADAYFRTPEAGSAYDSDSIWIDDSNDVYANLGNGDNVFVHQGQGGVVLADSNDTVDAGNGDDTVVIYTVGSKQVNTRGGDDLIDLFGTGNYTVKAGEGDDRVAIDSKADAAAFAKLSNSVLNYVDLGAGDDTLNIASNGLSTGVTEIWGRSGRDVVTILNDDTTVNTDHTLYVDLGEDADVLELRARDLKNDDTITGGNDGSIDQLILQSNGVGYATDFVSFSDTSRVKGFELIDLRGSGADANRPLTNLKVGGLNFTLTENLIAGMDQDVSVGEVVSYVYGIALPGDGAGQDSDGDNDGLFTAGVLGHKNVYDTKGVLTISTVAHGANDSDDSVAANNAIELTQTLDLRALGDVLSDPTALAGDDRSFVNFLGGTARDVIVVDERSFNSFSNLRFDEFDFASARANKIDEDNSTLDTLYVVADGSRNEVVDISFGDYRNVQGLDVVVFSDSDNGLAGSSGNFRLEASKFLIEQTTTGLLGGGAEFGSLFIATADLTDTITVYAASGEQVTLSLLNQNDTLAVEGGNIIITGMVLEGTAGYALTFA